MLALTWADIDWERGRFLVRSSQTEHALSRGKRWVPLFPGLRPYLEALFDAAPPGQIHIIQGYRDSEQNLRTTFKKIILRAGLLPWPRLFQNLWACRKTELTQEYPLHAVVAWMGNTTLVAAKHYLSVAERDYEKALHAEESALQNPVQSGADLGRRDGTGNPKSA